MWCRRVGFVALALASCVACARPRAEASVRSASPRGRPPAPEAPGPDDARYAALPRDAAARLRASLAAARPHINHVWRDTKPLHADGTLVGYVEISRGDSIKWEFDIATNRRAIDRRLADVVGPYPVNYGFVPQTLSFDGDPLDVLVLGPPIAGGELVRGRIVGILYMDDEKGPDMKVVTAPVRGAHELTDEDKARISAFFDAYKLPERAEGKWSKVLGWGPAADGRRFVERAHRFFERAWTTSSVPLEGGLATARPGYRLPRRCTPPARGPRTRRLCRSP